MEVVVKSWLEISSYCYCRPLWGWLSLLDLKKMVVEDFESLFVSRRGRVEEDYFGVETIVSIGVSVLIRPPVPDIMLDYCEMGNGVVSHQDLERE